MAANGEAFHLGRVAPAEGCASVLAIGTAVPPTFHDQDSYPEYFFDVTNTNTSEHADLKRKFSRICKNSGIKKRHFYMTKERLLANPNMLIHSEASLTERQQIAISQVPLQAYEAASKAIKEWGRPKSDITHVVFCTTSGVNMPGADHTVSRLLGLKPTVRRVMMYQIGCFGGASILRVGKDLAENNKGARVLVIASEVTCVTFRAPSETHLDGLVGSALFGDGASALIVGSDPIPRLERAPIFEIKWAGETICPDSDSAIEGRLLENGLVFHLLKDVPGVIADNIEEFLTECKKAVGSPNWNDMFWAVHPGGPAILDQIETRLGLSKERMGGSRDTLADYGNMSSAAVLFVLDRIRQRSVEGGHSTTGEGSEYGFLIGFGPGLTLEVLVLKSMPLNVIAA